MGKLWEDRLRLQTDTFSKATKAALEADSEIATQTARLRELREEQSKLRTQHCATERAVRLVWDQQAALASLLTGFEEVLGLQLDHGAGTSRVARRADALGSQLDELDAQVTELSQETRRFQATRCAEPLVTVAHVLNAHSSELDSIEARVSAAEQKFQQLC